MHGWDETNGIGEELAGLLVDSVVDYAIFVIDPDGYVRTWNTGAERLKGYSRDEIVGRHFSTFYPPEDRDAGLPGTLLERARIEGRAEHTGWRVRRDGSRFWADVTITALRRDGDLVGFAKVTRDLSDRREAEAALQRALEREREAASELARFNELRSQFLAGVVHDLRTPLVALGGVLDLLEEELEPVASGTTELVEVASRNTVRLARLVDQLSELAKLESGRIELSRRTFALGELIERCIASLGPLLGDLGVDVDVDGATVRADETAVERILTNLLTNAIEHAPPASSIRVTAAPSEGHEVVVTVADQGPGVAATERDLVFEEFRQGSGPRGKVGGLGLGLSIVRHYVDLHGGRIWIDDGADAGAVFRFTLPAAQPEDRRDTA